MDATSGSESDNSQEKNQVDPAIQSCLVEVSFSITSPFLSPILYGVEVACLTHNLKVSGSNLWLFIYFFQFFVI